MIKDRDSKENHSLSEMVKAGEPLMERAVQVLRRYHEAQETLPTEDVEKFRLEAEALRKRPAKSPSELQH